MDLSRPPRELTIEAADWDTLQGEKPQGRLVIQPVGPLLSAAREGWVVLSGWRSVPEGPSRRWTMVLVRQSAVVDGDR